VVHLSKIKGVQTMLDLVMELMPSPMDKESVIGTNPDTGEEVSRRPDYKEPFAALGIQNCN
jgi:elongation factor G